MGERSAISWTTHSFNPWWGCVKVSPACTNCYAAAFDHRLGGEHWGPKSPRKFFGDKHWDGPRKWNESAAKRGVRERVFCASMADVFEARNDLDDARTRLYQLIDATPHLDWLLLTKRPENIANLYPVKWLAEMPKNVWLGTTVENQEYANERIPHLLAVDAVVHFLSCEPLLGPVDLNAIQIPEARDGLRFSALQRHHDDRFGQSDTLLDWVIAGCESGPKSRECQVEWLRSLRDQCASAGVAFFLKQAVESLEPDSHGFDVNPDGIIHEPIRFDDGSKAKGRGFGGAVIELPYLDDVQHAAFPEVGHD